MEEERRSGDHWAIHRIEAHAHHVPSSTVTLSGDADKIRQVISEEFQAASAADKACQNARPSHIRSASVSV